MKHHPPRRALHATLVPITLGMLSIVFPGCERRGAAANAPEGVSEPLREPPAPAVAAPPDQAWTVPPGWTLDPEPRRMRLATYMAPAPSGAVEVAVTRFGGRVGGELANVNRWRGQMGLGPINAAALETVITRFAATGHEGYQVRIESASGVMLAAGVFRQSADQTWFVRATVPDPATADLIEADVFSVARSVAGLGD